MIHLFRHATGKNKGKFDIALIVKGKYIMGSNQGYERKRGCYSAIKSLLLSIDGVTIPPMLYALIQDDTFSPPIFFKVVEGSKSVLQLVTNKKPSKPYIPQSKK